MAQGLDYHLTMGLGPAVKVWIIKVPNLNPEWLVRGTCSPVLANQFFPIHLAQGHQEGQDSTFRLWPSKVGAGGCKQLPFPPDGEGLAVARRNETHIWGEIGTSRVRKRKALPILCLPATPREYLPWASLLPGHTISTPTQEEGQVYFLTRIQVISDQNCQSYWLFSA